jgi:hypothetical protein
MLEYHFIIVQGSQITTILYGEWVDRKLRPLICFQKIQNNILILILHQIKLKCNYGHETSIKCKMKSIERQTPLTEERIFIKFCHFLKKKKLTFDKFYLCDGFFEILDAVYILAGSSNRRTNEFCLYFGRLLEQKKKTNEFFPVTLTCQASNTLLDEKLNPKIADFGLAKLFQEDQSHVSTRVAGT